MDFSKILNSLVELSTTLGLKILGAIIILIVGFKLVKWIKKWIRESSKLDRLDGGLRSFLASFGSIVLYILIIITVATILGVPTTSFITLLASCGVAIGLALQGSLSNFAGGLMILFFKPFKIGDYIEASGESGKVSDISVVYTELLTPDNKKITIPNGTLTNSVLINYSAEKLRRVDFTFNADYNCNIGKVKDIILKEIENHPLALKEPEPMVRLSDHGESALTYVARVWVKSEDYWDVKFDITESVKKAFDENNISIPYPQIDINLKNK